MKIERVSNTQRCGESYFFKTEPNSQIKISEKQRKWNEIRLKFLFFIWKVTSVTLVKLPLNINTTISVPLLHPLYYTFWHSFSLSSLTSLLRLFRSCKGFVRNNSNGFEAINILHFLRIWNKVSELYTLKFMGCLERAARRPIRLLSIICATIRS